MRYVWKTESTIILRTKNISVAFSVSFSNASLLKLYILQIDREEKEKGEKENTVEELEPVPSTSQPQLSIPQNYEELENREENARNMILIQEATRDHDDHTAVDLDSIFGGSFEDDDDTENLYLDDDLDQYF